MHLPSREEIDVFGTLDEKRAVEHFCGKNLDEATALFQENSCYYAEDLMWMGPIAFRFYVQAAIQYLRSDAATGDSSMASGLASVLEFRLKYAPAVLVPACVPLAAICAYIAEHACRFDLGNTYEDVPARFVALRDALTAMTR